jgi:serine/threonine protein kinase
MASAAIDHDQSTVRFTVGEIVARKYEVTSCLATRQGASLYLLTETATGIERTAHFFTGSRQQTSNRQAQKLHRLRSCDILMTYRTQETIAHGGRDMTFLVSDAFRGELLQDFLKRSHAGRLSVFEGLHLLYALTLGIEKIHQLGEAHGAIAANQVLLRRRGLSFQVKLLECGPSVNGAEAKHQDVVALIQIFLQVIGGPKGTSALPAPVRTILAGITRPMFDDARDLKDYLETIHWHQNEARNSR